MTTVGTAAPLHDEAWFEALFTAHADAVVRFMSRRGAYHEAEDLAAEVFAIAWRKRAEIPDVTPLAWLYRTANWTLANWHRKARAVPMGDNQDSLDSPDYTDPANLVSDDDQMRRALASLSARDREILIAAAWDGLSGTELAAHLGLSRGGADAALSRARSRLEEAIKASH